MVQAVTVQVGTDSSGRTLSTVDLHPGGLYGSAILTNKLCGGTTTTSTPCPAEPAGLYNPDNSSTAYQNGTTSFLTTWQWDWRSGDAEEEATNSRSVLDTMSMNTSGGLLTVENTTIAAMDEATLAIPGDNYMVEVGQLALGGPGNGTFTYQTGIVGHTFPGSLAARKLIPSNSFGLHYGSASLGAGGSLTWGGYDQSRVLGEVGSFNLVGGDQSDMVLSLLDVQIGVENGSSPFSADSFTGLLNSSNEQPTNLMPNVPYMYMDPKTCAAVAQHLPVVLSSYTNLYIWNTTDPQFERIINSPSYLAFVFESPGAGNLTIKVPFQLLNLTLDAAIVALPQQYFPCQPFHASDGSGHFILGKAFLQAAFLGINWQQSKFFIAQAPGPGAATPNLQPIEPNDATIISNPITDFASSWEHNWTPIAASSVNNNSGVATTTGPASVPASKSGLSSGAKAGIAVGVIVGVLVLAVVIVFSLRRWKNGKVPLAQDISHKESEKGAYGSETHVPHEKDGQGLGYELGGEGLPHEADAGIGMPIREMDAS